MTHSNPYGKKELFGFETIYTNLGKCIIRREQYQNSLQYFDKLLQKCPDHKEALAARSFARAKVCHYEQALEDIQHALKLDPDDFELLAQKSYNTYLNSEFEEAMVQNCRMLRQRKKPDYFYIGYMQSSNAIDNCLGEIAGRPLRDHVKIIRTLAWKRYYELQKTFEPKSKYKSKKTKKKKNEEKFTMNAKFLESGVDKLVPGDKLSKIFSTLSDVFTVTSETSCIGSLINTIHSEQSQIFLIPPRKYPYKPLQNYTTNIENFMAEKYLDSMYLDKLFLKKMQSNAGLRSPNEKGSEKILRLAKSSYKTVSKQQEILRSRRPFYNIKYQEAIASEAVTKRQQEELERLQRFTQKEAHKHLKRMLNGIEKKDLRVVLTNAEALRIYCDSKSTRLLPDKDAYFKEIYEGVCQAHFDNLRLNTSLQPRDQIKRIQQMLGLDISREQSTDSVVKQWKNVYPDYVKLIDAYTEKLREATSPNERMWLYHELGRFQLELKNFNIARILSRKCANEAQSHNNFKWMINSIMLQIRTNFMQRNKNDTKSEINRAINLAREMEDNKLQEYLEKFMQVVENEEFDDNEANRLVKKREKRIVILLQGNMKNEASHMFSRMSNLPSNRRMSILPGVDFKQLNDKFMEKNEQEKQDSENTED